MADDRKTQAAALRAVARGLTDAAAILDATPTDDTRQQRETFLLGEFDQADGHGLTREAASFACKQYGFSPQTSGAWARSGWIETRDDGLRYLTDEGRQRARSLPH
jgi:hypothetical protein